MTSKKKYCFFSSMPRKKREVIMYRQGRSLIADGFEVYNVVCDSKPEEVVEGINVVPTRYKASGFFKRAFVAPRKLYKKLLEVDADVYHTVNVDQLMMCLRLKRKGKNVIFEMQEDHPYSLLWKSKAPKWFLKPVVWLMAKWMGYVLRQLDVVTALSYDSVDYLKSWRIAPDKVYLWGNFPEINQNYELKLEDYLQRDDRLLYFGII